MNLFKYLFSSSKQKSKIVIYIKYNGLQAHSGIAQFPDEHFYFLRIKVNKNYFILYASDNGATKKGRVVGVYNLDNYELKFLNDYQNLPECNNLIHH